MTRLLRTDAFHPDFIELVRLLDADLATRDGDEHAFYATFNTTHHLKQVIIAYQDGLPVACGAIRPYEEASMEVKRMYTLPAFRGKGIAGQVLTALERWASDLHAVQCILETGRKQPEAIALYTRQGYTRIPNYGPYVDVKNSLCFEKRLTKY